MHYQSITLEFVPTIGRLNVPDNGGHCLSLQSDGLDIYLPGYGTAAADNARELASRLIAVADSIHAPKPQLAEPDPEGQI